MSYTIESWYNRQLRLWTCLWIDANHNQAGAAQYANDRAERDQLLARMRATEPVEFQI